MKRLMQWLLICFTLLMLKPLLALDATNSPLGFWKTIDDVTGKPKSILQIWDNSDKGLVGRVLKIYPRPGHDQNERCIACIGQKHNQPIIGMVVLENLKRNQNHPNEWQGGDILDPKNGKTYHCTLQVLEGGQKLNVRGYIGVPLFGRSQTWLRVSGPEG